LSRPSPEEQARLKAEKLAKKAAKKAKFGTINEEKNTPVCEIRIPWEWDMGPIEDGKNTGARKWKHVSNEDLQLPKWQNYMDTIEYHFRIEPCFVNRWPGTDWTLKYTGPLKRKIIRT
jgi:hypothetical protein